MKSLRHSTRPCTLGLLLAALACLGVPFLQAQNQAPAAPAWYDQEKLDAFGEQFAALLNEGRIDEASKSVPFDGIYGAVFAEPLGEKQNDPDVKAYLKEFYPIFVSLFRPQGGEDKSIDFLKTGVEGGTVYLLMRVLPKNEPKAPEFNYLQLVVQPGGDGSYVFSDIFSLRTNLAASRAAQQLFLLLMPEPVYEKIGGWSGSQAVRYSQRGAILAIFDQVQADDPACLDSFEALDPQRLDDLMLLDAVSKCVFKNSDDPEAIKRVMKLWQAAQPNKFSMLIWNACGMRRLGGKGYQEANEIFALLRGNDLFSGDAFLDVLSADNSMYLNQPDAAEQFARDAIAKEPNLYVARHALHLILAKKDDYAGLAESLGAMARIDAPFTLKYVTEQKALAGFRGSAQGKALLSELQDAQ